MRWLVLAMLLSGCAGDEFFASALPPAPCDFEPTSVYTINYLPAAQAQAVCGGASACVYGRSLIILPRDGFSRKVVSIMRRHEFGHVNCPDWKH